MPWAWHGVPSGQCAEAGVATVSSLWLTAVARSVLLLGNVIRVSLGPAHSKYESRHL